MGLFTRLTGNKGSNTTVKTSGKDIEVFCSASAEKELVKRDAPLIVEIELAFACFARKEVRFHEIPPREDTIEVNEQLSLLVTTIIPDTCEPTSKNAATTRVTLHNFMPKWVRVDCIKGKWVGEYGL